MAKFEITETECSNCGMKDKICLVCPGSNEWDAVTICWSCTEYMFNSFLERNGKAAKK